jgi:hypothetical protein
MLARAILVIIAGALLAGCVDSDRLRNNVGGPTPAPELERDPHKQTLASRVLGAIALERVTKRKPDPARLNRFR